MLTAIPMDQDEDQHVRQDLLYLFHRFDHNGDGTIDKTELGHVLTTLDEKQWTESIVSDLFRGMDKDCNYKISFEEFLEWVWSPADIKLTLQEALDSMKLQDQLRKAEKDLLSVTMLRREISERGDGDYWDRDDDLVPTQKYATLKPTVGPCGNFTCTRGPGGVTALSFSPEHSPSEHLVEPTAIANQLEGTLSAVDAVHGSTFAWVRGEVLGQGTMGIVYRALNQSTGEMFAVKEVLLDSTTNEYQAALENELEICRALRHACIVSFLGHDHIGNKLCIYMEHMAGGSLATILLQFGPLDESLIAPYTRDITEGLTYLHTRKPPVLHRDVKGGNILVSLDCHVKLTDFGCSKRADDSFSKTMRGSIPWMAPEVVVGSGHGRKADVWSLGCVVIEMAVASPPWGKLGNLMQAMRKIGMSKDVPAIPDSLSAAGRGFIECCVCRDPNQRPNASQALQHDFLQDCALAVTLKS